MPKLKNDDADYVDGDEINRDKWNAFTAKLGADYVEAKDSEKQLKKETDAFKKRATLAVAATETLARKTVTLVAASLAEARDLAERYNPRFVVVESALVLADNDEGEQSGEFEFVLEEDPRYRAFAHVNDVDEMTYQKSIQVGGNQVDLDRLQANEEDWIAVSEEEERDELTVVATLLDFIGMEADDVDALFEQLGGEVAAAWERLSTKSIERLLVHEDDWTPEQSAIMQPYLYEGAPVVKFLKPREATAEELESVG